MAIINLHFVILSLDVETNFEIVRATRISILYHLRNVTFYYFYIFKNYFLYYSPSSFGLRNGNGNGNELDWNEIVYRICRDLIRPNLMNFNVISRMPINGWALEGDSCHSFCIK